MNAKNIALIFILIFGVSPLSRARGAKLKAQSSGPIKIVAFSDMNVNTSGAYSAMTKEIVQQIIRNDADLVLGTGDFIDGEKKNLSSSVYATMWNSFYHWILSPIRKAQIPFMPTPGNHDAFYSNERGFYKSFWTQHKSSIEFVDGSNYPFHYSFKKNNVFFISLDDAQYGALYNRNAQLTWLQNQLRSPTARNARARIVFGHIPLYSIATTNPGSSVIYENGIIKRERLAHSNFSLEGILLNNKVDLAIFGHSHTYFGGEYVYPDGRKLNVLSLPCSGGSQRYLVGTDIKSRYGYVEINISGHNNLNYQYYDYQGRAQSDRALPTSLKLDVPNRVLYYKKD